VINPTAISLRSTASITAGGTTRLEPFVTPYNATRTALKWSSSNTGIAVVSDNGVVTGITVGSATITVTDSAGMIKAECAVYVRTDPRPVSAITLSKQTLAINVGVTVSLAVTYSPSNATIRGVTWASNSSAIARVDPDGRITAVSSGTATITAISDSGSRVASCVVTVNIPVESIALPEQSITLKMGQYYQLNPIITPANATNRAATYTSRSATIATVSSAGLVTARRAGTTAIIIQVDGRTTVCTVTVIR